VVAFVEREVDPSRTVDLIAAQWLLDLFESLYQIAFLGTGGAATAATEHQECKTKSADSPT
jgi:hypothetical protein